MNSIGNNKKTVKNEDEYVSVRDADHTMSGWAKREVEIVCKQNNNEYFVSCVESALKAYISLMEDDHSGCSFSITASILKRLIDNKPLSPIYDTDDVWYAPSTNGENCKSYQCKRKSSLFKDVYSDGTIEYTDNDRIRCKTIGTKHTFYSGLASRYINNLYPIKMPYFADEQFIVYMKDYLSDPKNGDYDTLWIK